MITSRIRKAVLTEVGIFFKDDPGAAPTISVVILGISRRTPKNWAKRTSFQMLSGVLTANTADDTNVPVRALLISENLSSKVSLVLAVKYVAVYKVHTTKTAFVEKNCRGLVKGHRICFANARRSGRPVETLSTTDLGKFNYEY